MKSDSTLLIGIFGTGFFIMIVACCVLVMSFILGKAPQPEDAAPVDPMPMAIILTSITAGSFGVIVWYVIKRKSSEIFKDSTDPFARMKKNAVRKHRYYKR